MGNQQNSDNLDLIWGADAISREINANKRRTFYYLQNGLIPAKKIGESWVASGKALRRHFLGEDMEGLGNV
jgi:hypothetical protein